MVRQLPSTRLGGRMCFAETLCTLMDERGISANALAAQVPCDKALPPMSGQPLSSGWNGPWTAWRSRIQVRAPLRLLRDLHNYTTAPSPTVAELSRME